MLTETTDAPGGGKPADMAGTPALARQKAIGQHDQGEMPMQPSQRKPGSGPGPGVLGVLIALRNRPAAVRQLHQSAQRRVRRRVTDVPFHHATFTRHGSARRAASPPARQCATRGWLVDPLARPLASGRRTRGQLLTPRQAAADSAGPSEAPRRKVGCRQNRRRQ